MQTILTIDDSIIALTARKKLLERAGYLVLTATDGAQGLAIFHSQPVDLILMDYYVPGCGSEIRQRMKSARPHTPLVILSGAIELPEDMSNVDLFLSKLERPETLLTKIAELLEPPHRQAA